MCDVGATNRGSLPAVGAGGDGEGTIAPPCPCPRACDQAPSWVGESTLLELPNAASVSPLLVWGSQGHWHGHPSTSHPTLTSLAPSHSHKAKSKLLGSISLCWVQEEAIRSALPFVPAGLFSPLRKGTALKILLIMAGENGRAFWSTRGVSCAAYTRWANKHLA